MSTKKPTINWHATRGRTPGSQDSRRPHPEPSMTKNSSSSKAHLALNVWMDGARKMRKMRQKSPSPTPYPTLQKAYPSLLRTKMSTNSGDELNLRHFHCSRDQTSLHDHRDVHDRRNCTCGTSENLTTGTSTTCQRTAQQRACRRPLSKNWTTQENCN